MFSTSRKKYYFDQMPQAVFDYGLLHFTTNIHWTLWIDGYKTNAEK